MVTQVRAEVFHTLEGPQEGVLPTPLSNENLLINELVRDYLSYNGYSNALGVFMAESGQPIERSLDRGFIRDEVGIVSNRARPTLIAWRGLARPLLALVLRIAATYLSGTRLLPFYSAPGLL